MNYYDEMINEIKELIKSEEFSKALKIIQTELDMPYIPNDIEKQLIAFRKELTVNDVKNTRVNFSVDKIKEMLLSTDEVDQALVLQYIGEINTRLIISELASYFGNHEVLNMNKTVMLWRLSEQKLDHEFLIATNNNESYKANPAIWDYQKDDLFLEELQLKIQQEVGEINPSFATSAFTLGLKSFLQLYPTVKHDEVNEFALASIIATSNIYNNDIQVSIKEADQLKVNDNLTKINEIIEKI